MIDLSFKYKNLLKFFESNSPFTPDISIVLGSGLGEFADSLNLIKSFSTEDLPDYPKSTIIGHAGKIIFAEYNGKKILLFKGRIHFYEGYNLSECILPVYITKKLGCDKIILTNAAGGINENFEAGDLMLAESVNGMFIKKELTELLGLSSVESYNNMKNFPDKDLNVLTKDAAKYESILLKTGVYFYNKGPTYETPAEIQFVKKFGADAVGMSTVHEAIFASFLGIKVSIISCITNLAAGISKDRLSHSDVTNTAEKVKHIFSKLLLRTISNLKV